MRNQKARLIAQIGIVVLGAAGVLLGIYRGEAQTVLTKAVRVCLECIGVG